MRLHTSVTPISEASGREWAWHLRDRAATLSASGQQARARELERLAEATEAEIATMHDERMARIRHAAGAARAWSELAEAGS